MLKKLCATGAVIAATSGALLLGGPAHADPITSGNGSIGGGNQTSVPVQVPVTACGNQIVGVGHAGCKGDANATVLDGF